MKPLNVKWFETGYSLSEISQASGFLFSFLSAPRDGSEQCHQWVKCRDFLHDAVRTRITGIASDIFSFKYSMDTNPKIDMRRMRMLVTKNGVNKENSDEFEKKVVCGLKIVNHFEDIMEIGHTKIRRVTNEKQPTWLFNGPAHWLKSPFLVSMYTFLIRLGHKEIEFENHDDLIKKFKDISNKSTYTSGDNDPRYLKTIADKITTVATHSKEIFNIGPGKIDASYKSSIPIGSFHGFSGILSLCNYNNTHKDQVDRLKKFMGEKGSNGKN